MVVSSVNIYTDPDTTHVGKSFVNIEKSVGPTTDPCGILYDTGSIPEGTPFTIVTCSLPFIQPLVLFNTKKKNCVYQLPRPVFECIFCVIE